MVPLLQNSPNLSKIYLGGNRNLNSECFGLLVTALDGKSVEELFISSCNITADISALETYNLPKLQILNLNYNNIGREGCITLSNLLQKEGCTLTKVHLDSTGMGDEEANILATSLENNTSLRELHLLLFEN